MLGIGFWLCRAVSGWGSWCAPYGLGLAVTLPLLARVEGMCAWLRVSAVLRLSLVVLVVCVWGFGVFLHSAFSSLGVGSCRLLRAPRPFPATLWWGCLWRGVVRGLPWVGFAAPPFFFFFFRAAEGGWFLALMCLGCVAPAVACPGLGPLGLCPPFPFRLGCVYVFFFSAGPPLLWWGVCRRVRDVLSFGGPLLSAGCRRVWLDGPPMFSRGAP